jgi:hypothetical protein
MQLTAPYLHFCFSFFTAPYLPLPASYLHILLPTWICPICICLFCLPMLAPYSCTGVPAYACSLSAFGRSLAVTPAPYLPMPAPYLHLAAPYLLRLLPTCLCLLHTCFWPLPSCYDRSLPVTPAPYLHLAAPFLL